MRKAVFDRDPQPEWGGGTHTRFVKPAVSRTPTIVAIGLLIVPLLVALAALSGLPYQGVDILAQFTAPALAGALIFAGLLALLRLRTPFVLAFLVSSVLAVAVWPQWAPDRGNPRPNGPVLSIYSANLRAENEDTARIRTSIDRADPDVVVLIETSRTVIDRIDTVLTGYPYRAVTFDRRRGTEGLVIASRYPLKREPFRPSDVNHALAFVDTPLGRVNVIAVHLDRPWPYRKESRQLNQLQALRPIIAPLRGPTILAGDFNSVSSARVGRQVQTTMGLKPNPGWPGTWPARLPSLLGLTIDQLYRTDDLAVVSRDLGLRNGSDHRPLVTRLTLAAL